MIFIGVIITKARRGENLRILFVCVLLGLYIIAVKIRRRGTTMPVIVYINNNYIFKKRSFESDCAGIVRIVLLTHSLFDVLSAQLVIWWIWHGKYGAMEQVLPCTVILMPLLQIMSITINTFSFLFLR